MKKKDKSISISQLAKFADSPDDFVRHPSKHEVEAMKYGTKAHVNDFKEGSKWKAIIFCTLFGLVLALAYFMQQ